MPHTLPDTLYHYTCPHSALYIKLDGKLIPNRHAWFGNLVWLTDLAEPDRDGLGLTAYIARCNRLAARCTVTRASNIMWWPEWCRHAGVDRAYRNALEGGRCLPAHWYVAEGPVAVDHVEALTKARCAA